MKIFNRILDLVNKYVLSQYATLRKVMNFIIANFQEKNFKNSYLICYPYRLTVCPGNVYNLKCELSPSGTKSTGRKPGFMDYDTFKKIMDECGHRQP